MKNVLAVVALTLALSLSACTKKEEAAAPEGTTEQVEGTTTAPSEDAAPTEEMENKDENAAPAEGADDAHEAH